MNFPSQVFFNDINHGYRVAILSLFRMGIFGAAHGGGGRANLLRRISYNYETWHSYTLSKEDPKNISIT